ncbi:MAG: carboxypeptidase-like regulatory domain-containing protein [Prolixibacteraceae bacterium]|nr:carboxypeptidase-like regulatory domain-containing protein [Prolixibacteraceae bacterium]
MKNQVKNTLLITFLLFTIILSNAQEKILINGIVYDHTDFSPIPYAHILLTKSGTGTISQNDGTFSLIVPGVPDTLKISAVGYGQKKIPILKPNKSRLEIALSPVDIELNEVVIRPGENPAFRIIRNVVKNKKKNNPMKANTLVCNAYTKILVNSLNEKENIFSNQKALPIFFSEKISQNYLQQNPYYEKGNILLERQEGLGFFNELSVVGYSSNLSIEFNFYDNVVKMFDKPFISPINDNAFAVYKFYLRDSMTTEFGKEYFIEFSPKNIHDLAFKGYMKVVDEEWFLSEITTKIPVNANLNYVNKIDIYQTFIPINDSLTFFHINQTKAELKITKDNALFDFDFTGLVNKKTIYSDIQLNIPAIKPGEEKEIWSAINPLKRKPKDPLLIEELRAEELSKAEIEAIHTIDSLNNDWKIKSADAVTRMFLTGYIPGDYLELGPYLELIKYNKVEGYRFTAAGRTSTKLTKNTMIYGHVGYGTTDNEWKYGIGLKHKFKTPNRQILALEHRNDLSKLGDNRSIFLIKENMMVTGEDNIIASIFTNKPLEQLSREIRFSAGYEYEWKQGVYSKLYYHNRTIHSGIYWPFSINNVPVESINTNEIALNLRLSWVEKITDDYCRRYYLNTDYPVINLQLTGGRYKILDKQNNYLNLRTVIKQDFTIGTTLFDYILESAITFGDMPFPLLEIHRSDQSLGFAIFSFNMMNEMEFASDRFVSLLAQYHLNGFFFNRVPLLNKLGIREVFSAKLLWSHLDESHSQIMDFPHIVYDARTPYAEVSAGIENLLQYFRIDVVWRLTHLDHPGVSPIGIRGRFDVTF